MAISYAKNTDYFSGTGNLNTVWWTPGAQYKSAVLKRNSNSVGLDLNGDTDGAYAAFYTFSKMADNQSITIKGITGLSNGLVYCYLRSTASASTSGYLGQLFYSSGAVKYRALPVTSGTEGTEFFNVDVGTYSDSTTTEYTFVADGSTIKWQIDGVDVSGASVTDTQYTSGTAGFGIYAGGSTNYNLYSNSITVKGALASVGNFTNMF